SPGRLAWRGLALDLARTGHFVAGQRVSWLAPADHVLLHRRARPLGDNMLNPVIGIITALVTLGERTAVTLRVAGDGAPMLNFNVSTRTVRNGDIAPGAEVTVSLLPEGIHLMPAEG
ncbi:MAG: TOBE domain-containing protein, partial [Hyphomicrobium sp.]